MRNRTRWILWLTWGWFVVAASGAALQAAEKKGPSRLELDGAEHRLKLFEEKMGRAHGQPMPLGFTEK
ncbi:hypothetical protein HQ560_17090, partial [bacterium]|nr:hypothetical protein [bacterium]